MENWQISLLLFVVLVIVIGLCYQASKKAKKTQGAGEDEFEYEANGADEFDDDEAY